MKKIKHLTAPTSYPSTKGLFYVAAFAIGLLIFHKTSMAQSHFCHGPVDCATPGTVCPDGSVYVGCAAPHYDPLFTTRCDAGQTYSGSCSGTRSTLPWNDGNATGTVATSAGYTNGKTNTINLSTGGTDQDSNSNTGGVQPHQAAQYCADLTIHGRDDWYLPAMSEMDVLYANNVAIANFISNQFWSSSDSSAGTNQAYYLDFSTGYVTDTFKNGSKYIRCIRKN